MKGKWKKSVLVIIFMVFTSICSNSKVFGQQVYDLDIVAQTEVQVGTGTPVALGTGPSINDAGKVSFVSRDTASFDGRILTLNNGAVEQDCFADTLADVSDYVQINDNDQVIFRQNSDDGLFSDVIRLDGPCSGEIIGKGSISAQFPQEFDFVLSRITLNDTGRGIFSGDIGSNTFLSTRLGGSGPYIKSPALTGFPNLYPMLADNDTTVVRWGGTNTSPLLRFINTNLDTANFIAESVDFNAIGEAPGISDDGKVVAFVADHKTQGLGIYVSLFTGTAFTPIKVVGIGSQLSTFSLQARVGVNRSNLSTTTEYTITYVGFGIFGDLGLYTTTIDITDSLNPVLIETSKIISVKDQIAGLIGKIDNIKIYDPVNNKGQVAFWVNTDAGKQAIIRANPSDIKAFDPACELTIHCAGDYLQDIAGTVSIDQSQLDNIIFSNVERRGVVADGVTTLLLHILTDEQVTFTLQNPSGQSADSTWGTLTNLDGTITGNTVTINPVPTIQGNAAVVVYQAALDLPCSDNAFACTFNTDFHR